MACRKRVTVEYMRRRLKKGPHVRYTVEQRKDAYGHTESEVRAQLKTIKFFGKYITVHKKLVPNLRRVEEKVRAYEKKHGKKPLYFKEAWGFAWRPIKGGTTLSRHSHGLAIDVDPACNGYGDQYTDLPSYFIQLMVYEGFKWGGEWHNPVDSMHFEFH